MGVSIKEGINPIPVKFENSILQYSIGERVYKIPIPIKTLAFKEQCNMFRGRNVFAYLIGESYSMVLHRTGTGSVFTNKDKILCSNFKFIPALGCELYEQIGGSLSVIGTMSQTILIDLYSNINKDKFILTSLDYPISLVFGKNQNMEYLYDLKRGFGPAYPELTLRDGILCTINSVGRVVYKLEGTLSVQKAFTIL